MTLLLTADGQVAAALESSGNQARSNAVAVVSDEGELQMICGTGLIPLSATADEKYYGQVVRVSTGRKNDVNLTDLRGDISGDLDVENRKLGSKALAENVLVLNGGAFIGLGQLNREQTREEQILYARTNWRGQVDLIVLDPTEDVIYGRVFWQKEQVSGDEDGGKVEELLGVEYGNGLRVGPFKSHYALNTGDFVAAKLNSAGTTFTSLTELTRLKNVAESAWIGKSAVTFGGRTYTVSETVLCYNRDSGDWVTLDAALAYADTANLYVSGGVVRVVEVKH